MGTTVNSGLVVAGQMGAGLVNQDYTVMGDAVNLASRLQELAGYNEIAVGETTYQMTAPLFEWRPLGRKPVKGSAVARAWSRAGLLIGQVVKQRARRRLVGIIRRVAYGDESALAT